MVVDFHAGDDGEFDFDGDDLSLMWQSAPRRRGSAPAPDPGGVAAPVPGAAIPVVPAPGAAPGAASGADGVVVVPVGVLESRICALAGALASSTGVWLGLVAEFDRRKGWAQWGVRSCAHWLSWACSVAPGAAREYVRVASALTGLPLLAQALCAGRLSYSKVRAVTRVADRVPEATLLEQALVHTAAQLERVVRGYRKVDGTGRDQQARRRARWFFDEDGMLVLTARLPADEGAVLVAALTMAAARDTPPDPATDPATGPGPGPDTGAAGRVGAGWEADAVMALAHTALAAGPVDSSGDDRHLLVLHADPAALTGPTANPAVDPAAGDDPGVTGGVCRIEHGPGVDTATARRIACDAALVALINSAVPGEQLRLGRKTRKISPVLRRALRIRDGGCRFPGCHRRLHLQAHHIVHWLHGGLTDLDNLILLCRAHHMTVHEDGFTIEPTDQHPHSDGGGGGGGGGGWEFRTPTRVPIPANPALPPDPAPLDPDPYHPDLIRPGWRGEPFHLTDSVSALCQAAGES